MRAPPAGQQRPFPTKPACIRASTEHEEAWLGWAQADPVRRKFRQVQPGKIHAALSTITCYPFSLLPLAEGKFFLIANFGLSQGKPFHCKETEQDQAVFVAAS